MKKQLFKNISEIKCVAESPYQGIVITTYFRLC